MNQMVNVRVMELLCSRLCHDLISPVTAVNNGMELLAQDDGSMLDEVISLVTNSAGEASGKLQFYRIAYGLGGQGTPPISLEEARRLAEGLLSDGKVSLRWPSSAAGTDGSLGKPGMKLLLNTVALGQEALPRGGTIGVVLSGEAGPEVTVTANGTGARLEEASLRALKGQMPVEELTARSVHAHFTGQLAAMSSGRIQAELGTDQVSLVFQVPSAA